MSMIAVGERGSLLNLPDMYMRKLAVGPRARGSIDLLKPIGENVQAIADAFGRRPNDITTIVLDRPRHHDLIEEIRASGARIKLIQDGTVTASISAAIRGTNDHLAVGIGGTRQAVMSAAALRLSRRRAAGAALADRRAARSTRPASAGSKTPTRVFTTEELAPGEVIVAATGVSNGDLLRGVRFLDRLGAHALARDVHALQLGALHRRDPLLRARTARGSPAARLLARLDGRCLTKEEVFEALRAGRGSRARDGHRRARAALRRRGERAAREGDPQPHVDGLSRGADDPGGHQPHRAGGARRRGRRRSS